jgi:pyruvate/2-oxoglutarate dehydrogenase complex dihydrolipoamide acyltransferase (E2) component
MNIDGDQESAPEVDDDWLALNASQRAMARRMRAAAAIPVAALFVEIDAGPALEKVEALKRRGIDATFTAVVVYVVAQELRRFGIVAAEFDFDENRFRIPESIGVGVAMAAPRGLFVPVIHNAPHLSQEEIADELHSLVLAARASRLRPEMQAGGHFTVTNIGGLGVHGGVPLVNPSQNAILGVASVVERPVVRKGRIEVGMTTNLTLAIDHRALDGITAAHFLTAIGAALEGIGPGDTADRS